MSLKSKAIDGVRWTGLRSAVTIITGTVQIAILVRILEPKDFGLMAMAMIVLSLADVFVRTGFSDALIAKEKPTKYQQATLYWINIIVGFSLVILLYFSAPFIASIFNQDDLVEIIQAIGVIVLLSSTTLQFEALMQKGLYFKQLSIVYMVSEVVGVTSAIIFAINDFGVWSLVYSAIVTQLINSSQLYFYAFKYQLLSKFYIDLKEVGDFLQFGYFRMGASFVNQINSRADQFVIGILLGPSVLGYYSVAQQLILQPMSKINPILVRVSFPIFSVAKNDTQKLVKGYRKGIRILSAINAPLLFGMAAVSPVLIPLLLGDGWEKSIILVQILSIYVLLKSIGNVNIGLILAKEKYKWPFYWNLALLAIIPPTLFLVANLTQSIISVSIALVIFQFFLFVMNYVLFIRVLLGRMLKHIISDLIGSLFSAGIMGICVHYYINNITMENQWLHTISGVILGIIIYLFSSYFLQNKIFKEVYKVIYSKYNPPKN